MGLPAVSEVTPFKMVDTWEYDIVGLPLTNEAFNTLGAAGWELVCMVGGTTLDAQGNRLFVFKHHLLVQEPVAGVQR
jgi:hypothetical protein